MPRNICQKKIKLLKFKHHMKVYYAILHAKVILFVDTFDEYYNKLINNYMNQERGESDVRRKIRCKSRSSVR